MSANMDTNRSSIGSALSLIALFVCAGAALAQPAPGGPPLGAGGAPGAAGGPPGPGGPGGPGGSFVPMSMPLPPGAPDPSSDPRNLGGIWQNGNPLLFQIKTDMFGNNIPFNPAGKKVINRRVQSLKDGTPFLNASAYCLPVGPPWQMDLNTPFHIFQSKDRFEIVFDEYHGFMQIAMDAAKAPPAGYMGRSIGHWEGDTLVVETSGFKDGLWLDIIGTPASKDAKLTQRIRKVKTDQWFLETIYTLDDPIYYTRPWSWARQYSWRPDSGVFREYNCELQTGMKDGVDPSLSPEPLDQD